MQFYIEKEVLSELIKLKHQKMKYKLKNLNKNYLLKKILINVQTWKNFFQNV